MDHHIDTVDRRRLPKEERHRQLLDTARELIRDAGTDQFTLGRLAERAGVTKPVVYDHFRERTGVFAELYQAFEERQHAALSAALEDTPRDHWRIAEVVAGAYIDCCLAEGLELADVVAALAGSPTLTQLHRDAEEGYLAMFRGAVEPFSGTVDQAVIFAVIGAGDSLARHALEHRISADEARRTLTEVLISLTTNSPSRKDRQ